MKRQRCSDLLSMEDKRPKLTHPDNASTSTDNDLHHHPKLLNELKKPQIGAFSVNSSLKDMVKNFLPQIASANEQLDALPTYARQSIVELVDPLEEENERKKKNDEANDGENDDDESEEDDEESTFQPYIQMNLALGIFEEKKKQPKMIESLSDNDDDDEDEDKDDENNESDENESDENDENRLIIPTGGTNAKELRKQRLAMEREKALDEIMDALLSDSPHLNRMAPQNENGDEESELDRRKKLIEQLLLSTTGDDSDDDEDCDEDSDDNDDGEDENEASEPTEESAEDE